MVQTDAPRVLIVDDDEQVRLLLAEGLRGHGYRCELVGSADAAERRLAAGPWDLVVCDLEAHPESGLSFLADTRRRYPKLPVVMVSGVTDVATATTALQLGASGYITKPFEEHHVLIAADNALHRARLEAENDSYRALLEQMVRERTVALRATVERLEEREAQLRMSSEDTVKALARAIEGRDVETGLHIERMSRYTALLAGYYGFSEADCELLRIAAPMHDVGKIGVPDGILFKPGALSVAEYDVIKQHPELGYEILAKSEQPLLVLAATIARTHHERWDGNGYPHGLAGDAIPIEGRIAAVADVFDAVISRRCYKPAYSLERTLQVMTDGRGTSFDGAIVELLLDHIDEVMAIQEQYPDED